MELTKKQGFLAAFLAFLVGGTAYQSTRRTEVPINKPTSTPKPVTITPPTPVISFTPPASSSSRTVWPLRSFKSVHASTFLDPEYFRSRGYWHTGIDMNGPNGYDTDQGDSVYAIRDGKIVWVGVGMGDWGNMVIQEFQVNGKTYWAQYAHVQYTGKNGQAFKPTVGMQVKAGALVAFVGKGNAKPPMWAHLHLTIFHTKPPRWDFWPKKGGVPSEVTAFCTDADAFLRRLGAVMP
ncbi:M23 family metallopeptidase [Deinococcus oregonensis]|uniref:M23 family metallopeptidase n=1 Tax=Deinococcus oregonensis TaxID=1805970 RepID=A0ABV6B3Z9_9DEIO